MNCPCCRSTEFEFLFYVKERIFKTTRKQFQIYRCRGCGCGILTPRPAEDQMGEFYPEGYWFSAEDTFNSLRSRITALYRSAALHDHVKIVKAIARTQKESGTDVTLLDVGCGDGLFLENCGIPRCVGVDSSETAVRAVKKRGLSIVHGTLPLNQFQANSFSIVTMFHFLEHTVAFKSTLSEVRRLLRPEGRLVVQVPNIESVQAKILGKKWIGFDAPRHLISFSPEALEMVLEKNRFDIIQKKTFSLRDNAPMLAASLFPCLYPPGRVVTQKPNQTTATWISDILFLGAVLMSFPFALMESIAGRGATVTLEAKPK